jgi:acyl carrier protein
VTDVPHTLTVDEIEDRILGFIAGELLDPDVPVDRDDDLLSGELLDSVAILRLAAHVEEEFCFKIQPADLVIENFQTGAALAAYVLRATTDSGPSAPEPES